MEWKRKARKAVASRRLVYFHHAGAGRAADQPQAERPAARDGIPASLDRRTGLSLGHGPF